VASTKVRKGALIKELSAIRDELVVIQAGLDVGRRQPVPAIPALAEDERDVDLFQVR